MKVRSSWLSVACALVGVAVAVVLTSAGAARAEAQAVDITTQPALYPVFDPAVPGLERSAVHEQRRGHRGSVSSPSGTTVDVYGTGTAGGSLHHEGVAPGGPGVRHHRGIW